MAIPSGVIIIWTGTNASIPSNWTRETTLDAKYPKGNATATNPGVTGGALTHSHTTQNHNHTTAHTHTVPNSPNGSGSTSRDVNTTNPPEAHTHVSNPSTTNPTTTLANGTPSTDAINNEPAYYKVIFIKSNGSPLGAPTNTVMLWNSTSAPTGWTLCDGGGGRPDLRNVFLQGAATSGDAGGTGGAGTHTHTIASHTHTTPYAHDHPTVTSSTTATGLTAGSISGGQAGTATSAHTHVLTMGSSSPTITGNTDAVGTGANEPPYTVEGFLQNTSGAEILLEKNFIALWVGTLASIPSPWVLCDGGSGTPNLKDKYIKGANTLAGVGGTGGSATHTHTATGHTHAVASHDHTVSAAAGAGENRTAGAVVAATTAHTHPSWSNTGAASFTSATGTPTVDNFTTTEPPFSTVAYIQYLPAAQTVTPTSLTSTWSIPDPVVKGPKYAFPRFFYRWFGGIGLLSSFAQTVTPSALTANWSVITPTLYISNNLTPSALTANWSMGRPYDPCPAGPYYPASAVNDSSVGDVAWTNSGNAKVSDDVYAEVTLVAQSSNYLNATDFSFNISPEKQIKGIKVEVEAKNLLGVANTNIRIIKGGVVQTSTVLGDVLGTTESFHVYGDSTQLWGVSWTPTDINSSGFGVSVRIPSTTDTVSVDSIRITVYCAPPPQTVTPSALTANWSVITPTISLRNIVTPSTLTANWSVITPTLFEGGVNLSPSALTANWSVITPTTSVGGVNLSPSALTANWSIITPTTSVGGVNLSPSALTASWSVITPTINLRNIVTPTVLTANWSVITPIISLNVISDILIANWSIPTPNITSGGQNVLPSALIASWLVVTPTTSVGGINLTPSALTANWSVITPTLYISNNLTPSALIANWSVITPVLYFSNNLSPPTLTANWSVITPTVFIGAINLTPTTLTANWSVITPTLYFSNNLSPSALTANWSVITPVVTNAQQSRFAFRSIILGRWFGGQSFYAHQNVLPSTLTANWSIITPVVTKGAINLTPTTLTANWSVITPIASSGGQNVLPSALTASWSIVTPTISIGAINLTPTTLTANWSVITPTLYISNNLTPSALTANWSVITPTISVGGVNLSPSALTANWSVITPTISVGGVNLSPSALTANWSVITPTLSLRNIVTPSNLTANWSVITPTISVNIVPTALTANWAVGTPNLGLNQQVDPSALTDSWSIITPAITIGAKNLSPSALTASWSVITPTISIGARNVTPSALTANWSVITPVATIGNPNMFPSALTANWNIIAPSVINFTFDIVSQHSLGAIFDSSPGASITLTTMGDALVGNMVIVTISKNNVASVDGETNEVTSVTDSAGNTYYKAKEFCNANGAANNGVTTAVYYGNIKTDLLSGATITANFSTTINFSCISVWRYLVPAGKTLAVTTSSTLASDAGQPGNMSISGLSSDTRLFFRAIGSKTNNVTALTITDYTYTAIEGTQI